MPLVVPPEEKDTTIQWSTAKSREANKPGESAVGDVLYELVAIDLPGAVLTIPGFERFAVVEQVGGTPYQVSLWWGVEDGSPNPLITWDNTTHYCLSLMAAIRHAPHGPPEQVSLQASPESRTTIRAANLDVDVEHSLGLMFAVPTLDGLIGYSATPPGMKVEVNAGGYLAGGDGDLPLGPTGVRDAILAAAAWNVGAHLIVVPKELPVNEGAPVLTGTAAPGFTLSVSQGAWSNEPLSYAYQWEVSCHGGGWIYVPNPDNAVFTAKSTFNVGPEHAGRSLRCLVRAANEGGSEIAASNSLTVPGQAGTRIKRFGRTKGGITRIPAFSSVRPLELFDGAAIADYHLNQSVPGAITEVADPLGSGETVFKMSVHNTDVFPLTPTEDPRSELLTPDLFVEGSVYELEGAFMLPFGFPSPLSVGAWLQLVQVFGSPFTGNCPWAVKLAGNEIQWQRNQYHGFDKPWGTTDFALNEWIPFRMRSLQSVSGWVEMWIRGEQVAFFDPAGEFETFNPNGEPTGTRLYMPTIDESNFENVNFANIQNYRKHNAYELVTLYHKAFTVKAI